MWQTKNNQYPIKIAGKGTLRPEKQVGVFFGALGYFVCRDSRHFKLQNELGHGKRGGDGAFFFSPHSPQPFFLGGVKSVWETHLPSDNTNRGNGTAQLVKRLQNNIRFAHRVAVYF